VPRSLTLAARSTDLVVRGRINDRPSLEAVLEAPGHDPAGVNRIVGSLTLVDRLAATVERERLAAYLNGARLPWRRHVVDNQRRHARALDVAELLALGEVAPADVDAVETQVYPIALPSTSSTSRSQLSSQPAAMAVRVAVHQP
jgi:hypothetical protein